MANRSDQFHGQSDRSADAQLPLPDLGEIQLPHETLGTSTLPATAFPPPAPYGKVQIPRVRPSVSRGHGKRVSRACKSCRMRKTKCSGDRPVCLQCRDIQERCIYPSSAKEENLRQRADLQRQLQGCRELLLEAKLFAPGSTADKIEQYLQGHGASSLSSDVLNKASRRVRGSEDSMEDEDSDSSCSVGSLESLDQVQYDVNRTDESRAAGNIGKSSEITWMRSFGRDSMQFRDSHTGDFGFDNAHRDNRTSNQHNPHEMNYHLDDLDIGVPAPVQVYLIPPRELADTLFNTYLRVAHPCLPIINQSLFATQYTNVFENSAIPSDKWFAILNIIFAIAASYAQNTGLEDHGNEEDHLIYFTRTRLLSMNGDHVFSHPDLQQVQVEALIAFYLLSTDQIHRSWRISALAIRSAVSLGINLKNSSREVTSASKEARNRLWWSLLIIENRLSLMTGRPSCISVNMCSSPFPLPLGDDQLQTPTGTMLLNDPSARDKHLNNAMASSHQQPTPIARPAGEENISASHEWLFSLPVTPELSFLYICDLTILMQEMLETIYSPNSVHLTRRQLHARTDQLKQNVDAWFNSLPGGLAFTEINDNDKAREEKLRLACQYYSARIMLGRPFLCFPHNSKGRSDSEATFACDMAMTTVDSACKMAQLIPESPGSTEVSGIRPWWCCLHYVMQAATVLILELSLNCIHISDQSVLLNLTKRCIRWLDQTSRQSLASYRAWKFCDGSLRRLALSSGLDVDDLPSYSSRQSQSDHPSSSDLTFIPGDSIHDSLRNYEMSKNMFPNTSSANMGDARALFPSYMDTELLLDNILAGYNDHG